MKNRHLNPVWLWFVVFLVCGGGLFLLTIQQHRSYWNTTLKRVQTVDFNMLHASVPYAIAFLEEKKHPELIPQILNSNFGLFGMVYTDPNGAIKAITNSSRPRFKLGVDTLDHSSFSLVTREPLPQQSRAESIYDDNAFSLPPSKITEKDAYGKFYLLRGTAPSFWLTLYNEQNWYRFLPGGTPPSDYFVNVVINLLIILVLGILCYTCGRYQRQFLKSESDHFQAEIVALHRQKELVEHRYERTQQSITEKEKIVTELQTKMNFQSETTDELRKQNDELYKEWEETCVERDGLKKQLQSINEEDKSLKTRLEAAENAHVSQQSALSLHRQMDRMWPNLSFSTKAVHQIDKAFRIPLPQMKNICHLISVIEAQKGDLQELHKEGVEIKPWKTGEDITEIKFPPSRLFVHRADNHTVVEYIVPKKDSRSEDDVTQYFKTRR